MTDKLTEEEQEKLLDELRDLIGDDDPVAVAHAFMTVEYRKSPGRVKRIPFSQTKLDAAIRTSADFMGWSYDIARVAFCHTARVIPIQMEIMLASDGAETQVWLVHPDGRPVTGADHHNADAREPRR